MTTVFPGALDSLPRPLPTSPMNVAPYQGASVIDNLSDAIEAIEAKLGIGASVAAANQVLRGTGAGATAFGAIQTGDLAANAATQIAWTTTLVADSTTSTTAVDMAGSLAVTLTTTGGPIWAVLLTSVTNTSAAGAIQQVYLKLDAAAGFAGPAIHAKVANYAEMLMHQALFVGQSAGAHTVKAQWSTSAGTIAAVGTRILVVAEFKR